MKTCYDCKKEKPFSEFAKNKARKDGHNGQCKSCKNAYTKKHYSDNKDYYVDKARKNGESYRAAAREFLWDYLSKHPCIDCGESDPIVLELDHRDGVTKVKGLGPMAKDGSLDKMRAELLKCDVRCCNCHRRRTAKQFGWWQLLK